MQGLSEEHLWDVSSLDKKHHSSLFLYLYWNIVIIFTILSLNMRKSDMKMCKNKINKYTPSPETTVTHVIEISPFPPKIFHDITTPQSAYTRIFKRIFGRPIGHLPSFNSPNSRALTALLSSSFQEKWPNRCKRFLTSLISISSKPALVRTSSLLIYWSHLIFKMFPRWHCWIVRICLTWW